jgi:hypothetical protein
MAGETCDTQPWPSEIYLSDPRRGAAEKLKTVLRHPVRKA